MTSENKGICKICGKYRQFTFEHVPPKAAFNKDRVIIVNYENIINSWPGDKLTGKIQQKGMGGYTICSECNNKTGSWYGNQFINFCYQAMDIIIKSKRKPILFYPYNLYPLPIIKQIIVMFFSANQEGFNESNQELVKFVLNKETRYLPEKFKIFIYYNIEGAHRFSGIMAKCQISNGLSTDQKPIILSEISYPPFGYVMTIDSDIPDERLKEITFFSKYNYNEAVTIYKQLPTLPTHLFFPADYRNKEDILKNKPKK